MARAARIAVQCQECGKRFATANPMPECPRCGGVDIDLAGTPRPTLGALGLACVPTVLR